MKSVKAVIFRHLTNSDYFNIYKEKGTEAKGGGQTYIDVPNRSVSPENWAEFFRNISGARFSRSKGTWQAPVFGIGLSGSQNIVFHQRRGKEFAITAQRLGSKDSNRLNAWHPDNGFPAPRDPADRNAKPDHLVIFLVSTFEGEVWAGWFVSASPARDKGAQNLLAEMIPASPRNGHSGFLNFNNGDLLLDEGSNNQPFLTRTLLAVPVSKQAPQNHERKLRSEEEVLNDLFNDDEIDKAKQKPRFRKLIRMVRIRNIAAVKSVKELYKGKCQVTGEEFTFQKKDGTWYSEAHHLIPLGEEGADSAFNLIVVSPLIHRMLHFAEVSPIDLDKITPEGTLAITINGAPFTIRWHKDHVAKVMKYNKKAK